MKKIIKISLLMLMVSVFTISLFATESNIYTYDLDDVTIEFEDTSFSNAERERIASYMHTGLQFSTNSIWCSLLGHDMGSSESITKTTHLAFATAPRCKYETYSISTCSRCEYISSTLIGYGFPTCCS